LDSFEPIDRRVHVIAFSPNGSEILVVPSGDRLRLPTVEIRWCERFGESLTAAMQRQWHCCVVCLFTPDIESGQDCGYHHHVVECCGDGGTISPDTRWIPVLSLKPSSFANTEDYLAVRHSLDECNARTPGNGLRPFARPGWFPQLRAWVSLIITPLGLDLTGTFRQFNASPSFSLIRFETSGTAVWFKAVGEPNRHEFEITSRLAQRFADFVAPLLAKRADWHGWLSQEISGQNLGETLALEPWRSAATSLARLQVASIGKGIELLEAGARDLRGQMLGEFVAPFFETMSAVMERQTKFPPAVLPASELYWLRNEIQKSLVTLGALGIPDTLGSSDLNPGNVIVHAGQGRFLDWSEAHVGNPFFSFAYLLEHFRRSMPGADEAELVASYIRPWRSLLSGDSIAAALTRLPLLAAFAYAAAGNFWREDHLSSNPATSGYLRALTRRMHVEAKKRSGSELACRS
jgi:hypothetical protein